MADDPPRPMNPGQGNNIKNFLLTQERKREIYETTIINIDRTITQYSEKAMLLQRERLETMFLAQLKGRTYEEDDQLNQQICDLNNWINELMELKKIVMMNWLQLEQGSNLQM